MTGEQISTLAQTTDALLSFTDQIVEESRRHLDVVREGQDQATASMDYFERHFHAKQSLSVR